MTEKIKCKNCIDSSNPILPRWLKLEAELKSGESIVIDHIERVSDPRHTPNKCVYFKNGKQEILKDFKSLTVSIITLCNDPDCTDPDCVEWRKQQAENGLNPGKDQS